MTSKEALNILSGSNPASIIVGRIAGKKKHIEALQAIKQDLEKLDKIKKIISDTKASLDANNDPGMPAFIKASAYNKIKEVLKNE